MTHKRLTVLQVLPALESGGVERGTLELGHYLVQQGHRSLVMSAGGRLVEQLEQQGSEHFQWPVGHKSFLSLRLVRPLRHFLREHAVDILHVRSRFPAWICYLAWKGMDPAKRPRLVTTVHGTYSVSAYSAVMTKGERVIVISNMIRDYVLQHYPVDAGRLRLNYRGVDPDVHRHGYQPRADWLEAWYRDYPETQGRQLLTLPARLTRWKGQQDFITLLAQLRQQGANVHGLVVGDVQAGKTAYLEDLKLQSQGLDVADRITFTGHRQDIRDIMAMSHIVFSLSRQPEAFGRVTMEALSIGVPVIAYAHGGVAEQLAELLPQGAIAVGDLEAALKLSLAWLQQPPQVPENRVFRLQTMLENTLAIYHELTSLPQQVAPA
ncbi:glycosyltransferase involved in cell wall biosynthesis [Methylovorus glucosotrophus]|uniref:glycosyltransferase family 4 protein n=1 Tax=Methylovorus glucosotrophus TaxID=266009 RepID=UPI00133192D3|nr:glycosyltransferase family 4 protein [Methylovorus glucosotrophus]KAF0843525.1 glycosyltransferase involved in cell wall biosynthesis [Methylovorus glucosotrophus]